MNLLARSTIALASLLAACGEPPSAPFDAGTVTVSGAEPVDTEPVSDATLFTETAVTRAPDGSTHVSTRTITAGEERAQNAERARARAGDVAPRTDEDPACRYASFWLYDRADQTGNRICFAGAGYVTLGDYFRTISCAPLCRILTWEIVNGYYSAGNESGVLVYGSQPHNPDAAPGQTSQYEIPFGYWQYDAFSAPSPVKWLLLVQ
jgi:hypothetical protein